MTTWKELTTAAKVDEIRAVYPETIGTATAMASALSAKFREPISRNSVIGIYSRRPASFNDMPLSGHGGKFVKGVASPRVKPLVGTNNRPKKKADPAKAAEVLKIEKRPPPPSIPAPLSLHLFDLNHDDCRWPVGGEKQNTLFCGHPVEVGCSYCPGHKRLSVGEGTRSERNAIPAKMVA